MSAEQKALIDEYLVEKLKPNKLESLKKEIDQLNENGDKNKDKFEKFDKENDKLELDNAKYLENREKENGAVDEKITNLKTELEFMKGNWVKLFIE